MLSWLLRRFRVALVIAALASVACGACSVLLVTQINAALAAVASAAAPGRCLPWIFATAAVAAMLANMLSDILFERLRHRANAEVRLYIAGRVLQAPLRHLEQLGSPKVQSALTEHTANVAQFFVNIPILLTNGVIVLGSIGYLAVLSGRLFVATLLVIGLGSLGYHGANLKAIRYLRAGAAEQDRLFAHFRSLTEGAKELRLNRLKRAIFSDTVLRTSLETVRRQRTTGMSLLVAASSWGNFLIYAFMGLVLFVVGTDLPERARVLTGFALLIMYMVSPLQSLLLAIPNAQLAKAASERIEELICNLESTEAAPVEGEPEPFRLLRLRGVTHRYYHEQSNEFFALGPINLTFVPGQVTFLVGGNGSGKTTLAKLLVGLYPPEDGQVLLNDSLIDHSNRDHFRQCFSAVFGDFHLFDSLLDARGGGLDADGNRLLERLHLNHKVQLRDGAFTTSALSQGQRKRLALVVAYLEDRPLLVFDEWAADQDPAFKDVFYHEVLRDLRERRKAVIVISHDDRYFHLADQLIRMENGRVFGT